MVSESLRSEVQGLIDWSEPEELARSVMRISGEQAQGSLTPEERARWARLGLLLQHVLEELNKPASGKPGRSDSVSNASEAVASGSPLPNTKYTNQANQVS